MGKVFLNFLLFGSSQGFNACWYLFPENTIHKATTKFMEKEVLKTGHHENYLCSEIIGRCWVLFIRDYIRGRPKGAVEKDTYVCESRYNEQNKTITKIKHWPSCLPEAIRSIELELVEFPAPIVPNRVASALVEAKKEDTDDDERVRYAKKRASISLEKKVDSPTISQPRPAAPALPTHSAQAAAHLAHRALSQPATTPRGPSNTVFYLPYSYFRSTPYTIINLDLGLVML
jgi:chromatin structure-remodeling complex subunit RSC1/2